jgi:hypothetical protein
MINDMREVSVSFGEGVVGDAFLRLPERARGLVLFAHGSGSSRRSPRNAFVADALAAGRFASLLLDLLTPEEESIDMRTGALRFDIGLLARRLVAATRWARGEPSSRDLPLGYFGAAPARRQRSSRPQRCATRSVRSSRAAAGRILQARTFLTSPRRRCSS